MRPSDCKFSETHEWVRYNPKNKEAVIGITDYAVQQLSDLVHIELPREGAKATQGEPFGEIESVKTVADLVSPISGKITTVNKELASSDLEGLKKEPFEEGWLVKIRISDPTELDSLMTMKEYEEFLEAAEEEGNDDDDSDDDDFE